VETKGNTFTLPIRIQPTGCCCAASQIKIPNHLNNTQCPCYYPLSKNLNVKQVLGRIQKKKITCKLIANQASTFCTKLDFVLVQILNNYSKTKVLQSE
jgi:hypothetical protein